MSVQWICNWFGNGWNFFKRRINFKCYHKWVSFFELPLASFLLSTRCFLQILFCSDVVLFYTLVVWMCICVFLFYFIFSLPFLQLVLLCAPLGLITVSFTHFTFWPNLFLFPFEHILKWFSKCRINSTFRFGFSFVFFFSWYFICILWKSNNSQRTEKWRVFNIWASSFGKKKWYIIHLVYW